MGIFKIMYCFSQATQQLKLFPSHNIPKDKDKMMCEKQKKVSFKTQLPHHQAVTLQTVFRVPVVVYLLLG